MFWSRKKANTADQPKSIFDDPTSLGNVLLQMGAITRDQLYAAVNRQAHFSEALLGVVLKEAGAVTTEILASAVALQEKMRTGCQANASIDVLEDTMTQTRIGAVELKSAIKAKKQKRRAAGQDSGIFNVPHLKVMAGGN